MDVLVSWPAGQYAAAYSNRVSGFGLDLTAVLTDSSHVVYGGCVISCSSERHVGHLERQMRMNGTSLALAVDRLYNRRLHLWLVLEAASIFGGNSVQRCRQKEMDGGWS